MNYHNWLDRVHSITKTTQDNDVTDHTGVVYVEKDIELSWPIELGVISS